MSKLMIMLFGILLVGGCTAAQSSNSETVQTESDIILMESDAMQIEMVFVEGGTFIMGCTPEQGDDCRDDEKPAHQVTLSDFYIGKYEVTQKQWKAVMFHNPSDNKGDNLPVEGVTWEEVQEFIKKLNSKTGRNYRLPTEAEWEYAARGGNQSRGYKYSGSNNIDEVTWNGDYFDGSPHPAVGMKKANELGIYDMSANVVEFVNDWMQLYYTSIPQINPQGAVSGGSHITRGGNMYRVSNRGSHPGIYRIRGTGFRLAYSNQTGVPVPDVPLHGNLAKFKAVCESDMREIVEEFFQRDFDGYRLSSEEYKPKRILTWNNGEIGGDGPIYVIKSYRVSSMEEYEDACRVKIHFDIYGYIDQNAVGETYGLVFQNNPPEKEETVVIRCLEEGDCRISMAYDDFNVRPHSGKDGIYKWLNVLERQGTPSMKQEVRDLQEIIKSLP